MPRPPRPAPAPGGPRPRPRATPRRHPRRGRCRRGRLRRPRRRGRGLPLRPGRHDGATERRVPAAPSGPTAGGSASCAGMGPGQRYDVRVEGEWDPDRGCGTTPPSCCSTPTPVPSRARWPAARGLRAPSSTPTWRGDGDLRSDLDSAAAHAPLRRRRRRLRLGGRPSPGPLPQPRRSSTRRTSQPDTRCTPTSPEELRGTYAGLAHPASVPTCASSASPRSSCCPCTRSPHEPHLVRRGLTNHWGYNTLGFFAPHAAYAAATDPQGVARRVQGHGQAAARDGHRGASSTSSTTTRPSRTARAPRSRGAGWTSAPTTATTSAAATSTSPAAATPSTCATPWSPDGARLAALLGAGVPRRRLPLRPRRGARPRPGRRVRPRPPVPRRAAHRPRALPGQAHRRAVGRRHARLAHRAVPAAVHGVERPLPRRRAAVLGQRRARQAHGQHRTACRTSPPASPGRATCSATATAGRPPRSTSSPRTTASRSPTSPPTTTSTTRPTARTTATAATATVVEPRRRGRDRRRRRRRGRAPHRCATCSAPCCSRPACRCSTRATRWGAPSAATTTPTARTTRSAGSTGTSRPGSATCSRRPGTSSRVRRDLPALRQRVWALGRQVHDDGSRDMEWFAADGTAMGQAGTTRAPGSCRCTSTGPDGRRARRSSSSTAAPTSTR